MKRVIKGCVAAGSLLLVGSSSMSRADTVCPPIDLQSRRYGMAHRPGVVEPVDLGGTVFISQINGIVAFGSESGGIEWKAACRKLRYDGNQWKLKGAIKGGQVDLAIDHFGNGSGSVIQSGTVSVFGLYGTAQNRYR